MMEGVVAMVLAGGRGSRLNLIAARRAKPAVPFAGGYRIIDFTMTNLMVSGVRHVGVLTQYRPTSLMEHLGDGESWDLNGLRSSLTVLPPQLGRATSDWYRGTADAIFQNLGFLERMRPKHVLVLSGDHVYSMDYRPMVARHIEARADLTIAAMEVPWEETSRFGVMVTGSQGQVVRFLEKSPERVSNLANMGVYVFRYGALVEALMAHCPHGRFDFGADVIPAMLDRRVFSYRFTGYWRDVGTLNSYWEANLDALDPATGLDLATWKVRTNLEGRGQVYHPPARMEATSRVECSLVSRGCRIAGHVKRSILSPGVVVERGARVIESVVMHDTVIRRNAVVARAILDKDVVVGVAARVGREDARDGQNQEFPTHLWGGLTVVGKKTRIPDGRVIGANALVGDGLPEAALDRDVADREARLR